MGDGEKLSIVGVARRVVVAACLAGGWLAVSAPLQAQSVPATAGLSADSRPLNAEEGRAIAEAAQDSEPHGRGSQDCSHLVHQTYLKAGYEYAYASSFELYRGNEKFERVWKPQPGDLIVWPGHVGIVLEPMEHSFYSLVSTGPEAQNYQGPYWKSRGRPRFYRYRVESPEPVSVAKAVAPSRPSHSTKPQDTEAVIEDRTPAVGIDSNRPPKMASEKTKVMKESAVLPSPAAEKTSFEVPQSIVIAAGSKLPTTSQVAEGISELSNASGAVLRSDDPKMMAMPVVIFERLRVERLDIKRDHGWARLQIDSRATIRGGETEYKRRHEKIRWELRRTESGWEAIAPVDRTYVPSDVAVRNLAAQLARLTEEKGAVAHQESVLRQESQLANLLSGLLEEKKPINGKSETSAAKRDR
jgi:hypothetical protein